MSLWEDLWMNLGLRGLPGPQAGKIIQLSSGLTFGRSGDVKVADHKASSVHARILKLESGGWAIADNSSKNGTLIAGQKIETAELHPGVVFYIGDQGFEVIEIPPEAKAKVDRQAGAKYWYEILAQLARDQRKKAKDTAVELIPLQPAVVLDFVRGPQNQSRWVLGYGPRRVGAASLDLTIIEPSAPAVCFELHPSAQGILFKTQHPEIVQLNRQAIDSQVLRVGDTIQINDTLIEVDFHE